MELKSHEAFEDLVYLYFTQPRFDPEEWQNGIDQLESVLPNLQNQPNYKFQNELYKTLYGNNPRRQLISEDIVKRASLEKLEAKVDKHNHVVERMYRLESRVEALQNEISALRSNRRNES